MSDEIASTPTTSLSYLDFELEISRGAGRDYPVTVVRSPAGEAQATMRFPFDELALNSRLKDLQIALLRSGGTRRQMLLPEEQSVQDFGRTLLDALLPGEVRSRFDVSRGQARQQGKGLRLKLRIQAPELAALPWEFLYDPRQAEFVCLSRRTPIVRYLELPQPIQPLKVAPPLRVLGLIARPSDLLSLDVDREKQRVEGAVKGLAAKGMIQLEWLSGQTWRDLQRAMRGGPWHILHFVGHGGFNTTIDEGFIVLADEAGQSHPVYAAELGRLLADHDPLRLAVLNSCEGARGGVHDIFSSTASILIRQGLPAVLAMQYEISDRAAVEFSRSFYEALADGYPVDGSVAEARKAVSMAVENTMEWGTPVLTMRSPDGVLFDLQAPPIVPITPPPAKQLAQEPTVVPSQVPVRMQGGAPPPPVHPEITPDSMSEPRRDPPWSRIVLVALAMLLLAIGIHEFRPTGPASLLTQTPTPTLTPPAMVVQTEEPPSPGPTVAKPTALPVFSPTLTPTWTAMPTPNWTSTPSTTPTWTPTPVQPDLGITGASIYMSGYTGGCIQTPGTLITRICVRNQGTGAASQFVVREASLQWQVGGLAPGNEQCLEQEGGSGGTAVVDADSQVVESNENNNSTVLVMPTPPPTCQPSIDYFRADDSWIDQGACTMLRWGETSNATEVTINQGIGGIVTPGSQQVCQYEDTTYMMTLVGPGGTASAAVRVQVRMPAIRRQDTLRINWSYYANLDDGTANDEVAESDADIWFKVANDGQRYVTPMNGARIAKVDADFDPLTSATCAAASLSYDEINLTDLPMGTFFCVQTNRARYSQCEVTERLPPDRGTLVILCTTWE